ncbi:MAG: 5'/3'-nucleotidase SurE [Opitutaceae bacterium]|jgi:5'-nucleotidase
MRFLVTNDDGIDSPFLHHLVGALRAEGHELCVAAPRVEQSWIGAAKSRIRSIESRAEDHGLGCSTWVIDGTPSDCVNIALDHLVPSDWKPNGVISGINVGQNASLGFIIASGTVSGAFEGVLHGLPAVSLSQDLTSEIYEHLRLKGGKLEGPMLETLRVSSALAARMAPRLIADTRANSFIVHNLNFPHPCRTETRMVRTVPAHVIIPRLFSPADDDGTHRMVFRYGDDLSPTNLLTDRAALSKGLISHSILDYTRLGVPE